MRYRYRARTLRGELQTGEVEAPAREAAIEVLQRHNLVVTGIEPIEEVKGMGKEIRIFQRVKAKDLVFFFRQLSVLFSADVPLVEALNSIAKQTKNPLLRRKVFEISADVDAGMALSEALSQHKDTFSLFVINMVKTGEIAGNLAKVLNYLAEHVERSYLLTARIRGALYYPAFVVLAVIVVIIIMLTFVLPKMSGMFEEFGTELPLPTRIIVGLSNFFVSKGWLLLIVLVIGGIALFRYIKTPKGKAIKDKIEIKLPVIGTIFQNIYFARMTENLGTLIRGGIPIVVALDTVSKIIGNTLYKEVLERARDNVRKGETLAETFSRSEVIPPTLSQMIASGEKSGKLDKILLDISKFYNTEVDTAVNNLMSLLEPVLIVILGIGVGIVAAGVLLPIYNLAGSIR